MRVSRSVLAVLVLAVAATFAFAGASAADAATTGRIHGTAFSAYSGAPLGGISAGLYRAVDESLAHETTTTADGAYDFPAVDPGEYVLLLDDVSGRYWWEFWDAAGIAVDATPISITATETVRVDPTLDPVITNWVWFDAPAVSAGRSATPYVGQATRIEVPANDVPATGLVVPPALHIESSSDGNTWVPWSGQVASLGGGSFAATVTLTTPEVRYFRFLWEDSEFVAGDFSEAILLDAKPDLTRWSPVAIDLWNPPATNPTPGDRVRLSAKLTGPDGAPRFVTIPTPDKVSLQSSDDGVNWTTVTDNGLPGRARMIGSEPDGTYRASPQVLHSTYYRFWAAKPSSSAGECSPALRVVTDTAIFISSSAKSVRFKKTFNLSGELMYGHDGDLCVVEVQKPGSRRWSYSSARVVRRTSYSGRAMWWYRYAPKARGAYRFRVRYAGGITGISCVSRTISVSVR
jgi:hypothetical protein